MEETTKPLTAKQRNALEDFRDLKLSIDQLQRSQRGRVEFNFVPTGYYIRSLQKHAAPAEPGILITRNHLVRAYKKWREGVLSTADLANWAAMLTMNDDFDFAEAEEDLIAQWLNEIVAENKVTNPSPL